MWPFAFSICALVVVLLGMQWLAARKAGHASLLSAPTDTPHSRRPLINHVPASPALYMTLHEADWALGSPNSLSALHTAACLF